MASEIEGAQTFKGDVTFRGALNAPDNCIGDAQVSAANPLATEKLEHQHRPIYCQESDTTAAAETRVVHVVHGATGTLQTVKAGCVVANQSGAIVDVDVLVNGASVLAAAIEIDDADAAYALVAGTIDTPALTVGDVIEVDVAVTAGGGTLGKGVFCYLDVDEDEA